MVRRLPPKAVPLVAAAGLALSACSDAQATDSALPTSAVSGEDSSAASPSGDAPAIVLDVPDPNSVYDPVRGGETLPEGFRQLLARDAIAPVYDPTFTSASGVDWPDESLVIGVDLEGESRAYPVGFLNRREMVNDNHRGIPTLVTW